MRDVRLGMTVVICDGSDTLFQIALAAAEALEIPRLHAAGGLTLALEGIALDPASRLKDLVNPEDFGFAQQYDLVIAGGTP